MSNVNIVPIGIEDDQVTDRLFVTVEGREVQMSLVDAGISFDDSESVIMDKIVPMVEEQTGVDISDSYKIRKMVDTNNIFILPNSTAG